MTSQGVSSKSENKPHTPQKKWAICDFASDVGLDENWVPFHNLSLIIVDTAAAFMPLFCACVAPLLRKGYAPRFC
jgi:hypothetical protein